MEKLTKLVFAIGISVVGIIVAIGFVLQRPPALGLASMTQITGFELATTTVKAEHGIPAGRDRVGFPEENIAHLVIPAARYVGTSSQYFLNRADNSHATATVIVPTFNAQSTQILLSVTASTTITPVNIIQEASANGIDFYPSLCTNEMIPVASQGDVMLFSTTTPFIQWTPRTTASTTITFSCTNIGSPWTRYTFTAGTSTKPTVSHSGSSAAAINATIEVKNTID